MSDGDGTSAEAAFYMKPVDVIEGLARQFVSDQRRLAEMRQTFESLPASTPDDAVAQAREIVDETVSDWNNKYLPNLAASFRLALEVLDTYGPDGVSVEDATEAAIWNNKYFAIAP
ncbi:hypothetical protein Mycsm_06544 (plasmid) [Mycobacterium sp. JS623]|uniref:hypothetical protein n=1 Tax=Mycobacterium sp. JS623 TaxID=212767 RepID=UPI0002A5779D|nr:hypothetical protein [Mycobacterium sp. JS623]AGB26681.1 hypothetical protein Mycsm_06544 [Mycobacterium sp. JS623]